MRRIGIFLIFCLFFTTGGFAASRVQNTSPTTRAATTTQRVKTKTVATRPSVRVATQSVSARTTDRTTNSVAGTRTTSARATTSQTTPRASIIARAASDTRTGAEYEQCKTAYFACMDQFCQLKNDEYRRCSCSDRITSLQSARDKLSQAGEQLTAFNENLDIVGKTAAQATAMNTASDGELALARDKSASTALLNAIMNSIRGTDTRVENSQLSSLNSLDLSFDTANSFGTASVGQTIAAYNGTALYSAVYPQCRTAVAANCNTASLQRAVNAYLMAIEQDCNTVQAAINTKQKETHAAIRESSAMLDMARAENHRAHNSDDIATCLANVESAILSEEVCGANYHKCLDNGEYIDVSTGAPIAGVVDFYKLGTMLTFSAGRNNADQKLAQNPNNKTFVTNFEKRVKQFAEPALDKCYDDADTVWADYLNKALLDIYYAQQSKVNEIKQGCFDFVSACYMNGSTAMTNAMQGLVAAQTTVLNPNILELNRSLCSDYIASCNNMFDGEIVKDYISHRHDTDSLTACRAVAKQCFDNYGGQNYENFYNPSSGLFSAGYAPSWFALYEYDTNGTKKSGYVSECAKQLAEIDACKNNIETVFGGFDYYPGTTVYQRYKYNAQSRRLRPTGIATEVYNQIIDILQTNCTNLDGKFVNIQSLEIDAYQKSYNKDNFCQAQFYNTGSRYSTLRIPYSVGKQKYSVSADYGYLRVRSAKTPIANARHRTRVGDDTTIGPIGPIGPNSGGGTGGGPSEGVEAIDTDIDTDREKQSINFWNMFSAPTPTPENICPNNYGTTVDVQSWGACLCWENGGRRSNNGTSTRCVPTFPVNPLVNYVYEIQDTSSQTVAVEQVTTYGLNNACFETGTPYTTKVDATNLANNKTTTMFTLWPATSTSSPTEQDWCTATVNNKNQVCPFGVNVLTTTPTSDTDENYGLSTGDCTYCKYGWTTQVYCESGYTLTETYQNSNTYICKNSSNQTKTAKKCPDGYNFNQKTKKCVSTSNATDTTDLKCCPKGYYFDNSTCKKDSTSVASEKISSVIMGENFPKE